MFRVLAVLSVFLLSACATQPAAESARPVAAGRSTVPVDMQRPGTGKVALTITRDRGLYGAACSARAYVNGQEVAALSPAEAVTVYVPSGYAILGVRSGGLCAHAATNELSVTTEIGRPWRYRIALAEDGAQVSSFKIMPTAF